MEMDIYLHSYRYVCLIMCRLREIDRLDSLAGTYTRASAHTLSQVATKIATSVGRAGENEQNEAHSTHPAGLGRYYRMCSLTIECVLSL